MKSDELRSLLLNNNTMEAPDWNEIKEAHDAKPIEIVNGQPVYLFDKIFDLSFNPIEENVFVCQQLPSAYVPMHIHQYIEVIYVYQGQCTVVLQEGEMNLSEGGMIMIDKHTPHTVKGITNFDIIIDMKLKHDYLSSGILSQFTNKSIISQFLIDSLIDKRRANNYLYFPFAERSKIPGIMEQIMCEYFDRDFFSSDMINGYLFILFTELIRQSNSSTSTQIDNIKQKDVIVLDFLKYIDDHFKECSLTEMADHYKYHPNYISAVLKKATGKSFKDLLQIQRINKAALYLLNSDLPIPDIAEEVGYTSVSFFYKKFNDFFHQTPKEFRENQSMHSMAIRENVQL
ncbi:helix-turn-helix domain-containing protein [Neobacillus sp. 179-C4.2 HS]|uniref:Helix-turn-helix domain-containing protein n=1 Tax=Neobacillus driksii TaxID=3035913 RepID=A0ABV4YTY8_9BACI|nr:helix-turn-helix domain-containing protein [Neobacillus sp. 179.-C4.2 HS]MDP5193057.1 helix-turn-helix domain-containing protein [Neobacillus sp. 179.-C4.2 HS]